MRVSQEKILVRLPTQLKNRLEQAAKENKRTLSAFVRFALEEWLNQNQGERSQLEKLADQFRHVRKELDAMQKMHEEAAVAHPPLRTVADMDRPLDPSREQKKQKRSSENKEKAE